MDEWLVHAPLVTPNPAVGQGDWWGGTPLCLGHSGLACSCVGRGFGVQLFFEALRCWAKPAGPRLGGRGDGEIEAIATLHRQPGLDPGSRFLFPHPMERESRGGWVYLMADRYRGTLYLGVTSDLASRITQHREGVGSAFCRQHGLTRLVWADRCGTIDEAITHEKRLKRWRRAWKIELIEKANPDWDDLYDTLV